MALSKAHAAVLGGLVGDAACMPTHWIYDPAKLAEALGDKKDTPEFLATPSCPYYKTTDFPGHYQTGQLSPYGEQMFGLLELLSKTEGDVDAAAYVAGLRAWAEAYTGRLDHALKEFLANVKEGKAYPECAADDDQAQCFAKPPLAVAKYGAQGLDAVLKNAEVLVKGLQGKPVAADCGAVLSRILFHVAVDGLSIADAWAKAKAAGLPETLTKAAARVEANLGRSAQEMLLEFGTEIKPDFPGMGLSCGNPQAFMGFLHTILTAKSFTEGLRSNLLTGGDNCSRATGACAVLAAAYGLPAELEAKFSDAAAAKALLAKL